MMPWLAPLLYVGIIGSVWLFVPEGKRAAVRSGFSRDINLFLIFGIVIVAFGVAGTLNWRVNWVDWMAWLLAIGFAGFSVVKLLKGEPVRDGDQDSIDRL